ncbi:MAG: CoA transferase [Chitinophagales bacterium]
MNIQDIFAHLPQRFRSEKAKNYSGTFHFKFDETAKSYFTVQIQNEICSSKIGLFGKADCVITTSSKVYVAIELGHLNAQQAFMTGKIQVSNIMAMLAFSKMFRKLSASELPTDSSQKQQVSQESRKPLAGPLKDICVIDFSRLLPAPLATMLLADMGAEIIKIEHPESPDDIRNYPPFINQQSAYYLAINRSKRSLCLDLRQTSGKEICLELLKKADVLVESFRPGVMKKLGLDYASISKINPQIIYISLTGYGQSGPYAQEAGHDLNYIGRAGILHATGQKNSQPVIPSVQIADIAGGSYSTLSACLLALYQRERTGKGSYIDLSMLDASLPFMSLQYAEFQATGKTAKRGENVLSGALPNYNVYECNDGKFVALGALEPKFWKRFCEKVNRLDWVNMALGNAQNLEAIKNELTLLFRSKTQTEWLLLMENEDICLTAIHDLAAVSKDKHLTARNMFVEHEHLAYGNIKSIGNPIKIEGEAQNIGWAAPLLGEDTAAILKELGYTENKIAILKQDGVING